MIAKSIDRPARVVLPQPERGGPCHYCRAMIGIRWVLPIGDETMHFWLCDLCAEAALRVGRAPQPAPEPEGCRFGVEVTPGGRAAYVHAATGEGAAQRNLGFAVVYRAEVGDLTRYRMDLSGVPRADTRHYSGAACLAEAIADAKVLLAARRA